MKRALVAASAAGFLISSITGCIGGMAVTGRVRDFNLDVVQNRWAREGVFLLLYVIPVYPFAGMADLFVVNSIEFHTGTNPVSGKPRIAQVGETRREVAADGTSAVSTLREDGSIDFTITAPDGSTHFVNLDDRGARLLARDEAGTELGYLARDGSVRAAGR